jgi:hypothetical protein
MIAGGSHDDPSVFWVLKPDSGQPARETTMTLDTDHQLCTRRMKGKLARRAVEKT